MPIGRCGGLPLFDMRDPSAIMFEIRMAKKYRRNYYIKLCCFDNARGVESCVLSFIVHRPQLYTLKPIYEPGFRMSRQEAEGRKIVYTLESYSVIARAEGERYWCFEQCLLANVGVATIRHKRPWVDNVWNTRGAKGKARVLH